MIDMKEKEENIKIQMEEEMNEEEKRNNDRRDEREIRKQRRKTIRIIPSLDRERRKEED